VRGKVREKSRHCGDPALTLTHTGKKYKSSMNRKIQENRMNNETLKNICTYLRFNRVIVFLSREFYMYLHEKINKRFSRSLTVLR
jgi:hypothetical protein